ncbi:hypothetical protein A2Z22_03290 [Candidatus Woesebacteria bacterium RBG_16_34_12]|uniref:Thioredoxin domain-containing protein n=1 Tax=Candidatus Woesebacteria bacterium RBG_16_34_12 TaxID=1802480 RepID=A0A1F7XAM8_9BACT|nr:MAG: hypothetical protein A2Z22_03290 [Candidatus Woesebacteria bacterium RBG_16_34_12]
MAKIKGSIFEKLTPILVMTSIALAFLVGILWQKVSNLEGGGGVAVKGTTVQPTVQPGAANQPQGPTQGKLSEDQAKKVVKVTSEDHLRGNKNAKVFLIEYSDYQCPFCSRFHPTAQQVLDEYKDDVAWVYRHFPLDQLHPKARPSAEASECVAEIGGEDAWWKFTDAIFADQTKLDNYESVVSEIGIDMNKYKECVDSGRTAKIIDEQYQGGLGAGITGTPGNIILNQKGEAWLIPGALPFDSIKTTIDEALK